MGKKIKKSNTIEDVLLETKGDRRLLANVPDIEKVRTNIDRRGEKTVSEYTGDMQSVIEGEKAGIRYHENYTVHVTCKHRGKLRHSFTCMSTDISVTGMLLEMDEQEQMYVQTAREVILKFEIIPGTMPEGYEMKIKIKAQPIRFSKPNEESNKVLCGMEFEESLAKYAYDKKNRSTLFISSLLLLFITLFIVLMRAESVIYFRFNKYLYLYSIIAAAFLLSRYFFGALYKPVPIDPNYTPGVTIVIPCFNEEEWIQRTILSCINQDYPIDSLEVIVVDDCSNDNSVEKIKEIIDRLYKEADKYKTKSRLSYIVQKQNMGKREAMAAAAKVAKHDLVVFVDSDSFLDPFAVRNLVQPFKDSKMGGVSGRTDVANTYTNTLTKMQSVRYYISFRIMKAAEAYFDAVTCLSGPLSCYRKQIILDNMDAWLNQKFLGQKATFGDDRSMTNFILRNYRTSYQDAAVCATIVPNQYKVFLKQQMRWKRSWLRESIIAGSFMWIKEPFMALFFYMGLIVPIAAPVVVLYNLLYVPIMNRVFPTTFLVGILLMSFLMSAAQLFLRKSSTWFFGVLFCLYYEVVLLWQMPIAWVTFWKSTWGTRMTPEDIKAENKAKARRMGVAYKEIEDDLPQSAIKQRNSKSAEKDEDEQIRRRAINLVRINKKSIKSAAKYFEISQKTLRLWLKEDELKEKSEYSRLRALEEENKKLKQALADREDTIESLKKNHPSCSFADEQYNTMNN